MKKLLFFVLFLTFVFSANAQYVSLPDGEFKQMLQNVYPGCFNQNQELDTTCNAIVTADTLGIGLASFGTNASLEGLQYFKQLKVLYINGDFALTQPLPATLEKLVFSSVTNTINLLCPSGLKYLSFQFCANVSYLQLPSSLDSILFCSCDRVILPNLPPNLLYADFSNTSSLIGGPSFPLPATLKYLNLSKTYNPYVSAPTLQVTLPNSLEYFNCNNRAVRFNSIPPNLKTLQCSQSGIEALSALPRSLLVLDCSKNILSGLPSLPDSLIDLDFSNTTITSCPALPLIQFTSLRCSNTQLTSLPDLPATLRELTTSGSFYLGTLPALPQNLKLLLCANNSLTTLPTLPQSLNRLECNNNNIEVLPQLPDSLSILNCANNSMSSPTALPVNLTSLNCSYNLFQTMPELPASLSTLACSNNQIQTLSELPAQLTKLDCGNNLLSVLPAIPQTLTHLTCDSNSLTLLPQLNNELLELRCESNQLTELPALSATLRLLNCKYNLVAALPPLPEELRSLNCAYNQLISLPNLPQQLEYLYCQNNRIAQIAFLPLALKEMNCSYNELVCLPKLPFYCSSTISFNSINCLPNRPMYMVYNQDSTSGRNINLPVCNPINNINHCSGGNRLTGVIYYDLNANGIHDSGEPYKKNCRVSVSSGTFTFTNEDGYYELPAQEEGEVTITATAPPYFDLMPPSRTYFIANRDTVLVTNFSLQANANVDSPVVSLTGLMSRARPGFPYAVKVSFENAGTITSNTTVLLDYDETKLEFDSCSNAAVVNNGSVLSLQLPNFQPVFNGSFMAYFHVKSSAILGDSLSLTATISNSNTAHQSDLKTTISGAFDPNDKQCTPTLTPDQVANGEYIDYTIRFQNTGTDTAFTVVISDTLSSDLQASTLQMISASHSCKATVKNNIVFFEFLNILLPDSNVNEIKSHGFVTFKIKPRSTISVNSDINNKAAIYFDYNAPVITNTAVTAIRNPVVPLPLSLMSFTAARSTTNTALLEWNTANEINTSQFIIQQSTDGRNFTNSATESSRAGQYNFYRRSVDIPTETVYLRLKMMDVDGRFTYSPVILLRKQGSKAPFTITNNPVKGTLNIEVADAGLHNTIAGIVNAQGVVVQTIQLKNKIESVSLNYLPTGTYLLQTSKGTGRFIIAP